MKLSKAREIIELNIKEAGKSMPPDTLAALKLENEATKHWQYIRTHSGYSCEALLPGETEE